MYSFIKIIYSLISYILIDREKKLFILCGLSSAFIYFIILKYINTYTNFETTLNFTISFTIASLYNFTFNRVITFKASNNKFVVHALKYILMILISYFINLAIISFYISTINSNVYVASIVSIGIVTIFRFILSKHFVYKL